MTHDKENIYNSGKVTGQASAGKSKAKNAVAGVAGAMAGMGGVMPLMSFKEPEAPVFNPDPDVYTEPVPEPPHFDGTEVSVAYGVNDHMTFAEAFAAARREVGSGGVFQWCGDIYGTYYAEEWQGFSDEYKQEFSSYHYDNLPGLQPEKFVPVAEIVADDFASIHEAPMVFVDADFDSSYDIVVISDADYHEDQPVYMPDDDGMIAYESPHYDSASDFFPDFYNNADISDFV